MVKNSRNTAGVKTGVNTNMKTHHTPIVHSTKKKPVKKTFQGLSIAQLFEICGFAYSNIYPFATIDDSKSELTNNMFLLLFNKKLLDAENLNLGVQPIYWDEFKRDVLVIDDVRDVRDVTQI